MIENNLDFRPKFPDRGQRVIKNFKSSSKRLGYS